MVPGPAKVVSQLAQVLQLRRQERYHFECPDRLQVLSPVWVLAHCWAISNCPTKLFGIRRSRFYVDQCDARLIRQRNDVDDLTFLVGLCASRRDRVAFRFVSLTVCGLVFAYHPLKAAGGILPAYHCAWIDYAPPEKSISSHEMPYTNHQKEKSRR